MKIAGENFDIKTGALSDVVSEPATEDEITEFRSEFLRHYGFEMPGVDYNLDVDPGRQVAPIREP